MANKPDYKKLNKELDRLMLWDDVRFYGRIVVGAAVLLFVLASFCFMLWSIYDG
jgi:hypothetical protein